MDNVVSIHGHDIRLREYNGKRVVTFKDIDEVHERPIGTASRNFLTNRQRFINGVDFVKVKSSDFPINEIRGTEVNNNGLTLITESGYLMLVKSFNDELAWKVQREIVDSYFRRKEAEPAAPIKVLPMEPTTYLEAARIMATVPYSKREVMNILKHLIPDIDAGATAENPAIPVVNKEETKKPEWKEFYKQGVPVDTSKLKKHLKQNKVSVAEVAHRAGISDSTVYNILNGKTRPTKETKERICSALKKDSDWLDP
ncbi:helix-turn-helix domain-containing protein [Eisenbergiella tayi]|uniref:Helix-turn-helix domain-containing protein n=1 Tax=Eisenbergiella porci TaxID=2652274 RepID=A0A6N7WKU0_9FIRM|nr:ORF6N domain-containing protein [Eisenbergiella porci]MSS91303.1 helix-turn-helix domain-containing protein [Eisenbergiella porci]